MSKIVKLPKIKIRLNLEFVNIDQEKKIKKIRRIYVTLGTRKCSHPLGLRENLTVRSRGCRKRVKLERQSNTLPLSVSLGCQRLRHGNKSHAATPMAGRLRAVNKKEGRRDVVS